MGKHENGRISYGRTILISPWGEITATEISDEDSMALADIDITMVENFRKKYLLLTKIIIIYEYMSIFRLI